MVQIVAEIGSNWTDLESALSMVDLAARLGADCVKFQDFRVDQMRRPQEWKDRCRPWENPPVSQLADRARLRGLGFLCSVWDSYGIMQAHTYGYTAIKVASSEITNQDLLMDINDNYQRLPVWLSVPHDKQGCVVPALTWLHRCRVTLLHCVAEYPAPSPQYGKFDTLKAFGLPVGWSSHLPYDWVNHTVIEVRNAADTAAWFAKNGATVVEAHLRTHDTPEICPDAGPWALYPEEFAELVKAVRDAS